MQWFYDPFLTKSLRMLNVLIYNVLLALDFDVKDLTGFNMAREARRLDDNENTSASATSIKDGWIETTVPISVPCDNVSYPLEVDAPVFHVKGLMYHKPLEVIKAVYKDPLAEQVHISPYEKYWQPQPNSPPERIYSELYNSNAFILEHEKVCSQPQQGCELETVIAAIMISSDYTHLMSFSYGPSTFISVACQSTPTPNQHLLLLTTLCMSQR